MAVLFVDSNGGAPSSPYTNWTDAAPDIFTALADGACVAGSTVYVAHNHLVIYTASKLLDNAGTVINPIKITCVNTTTGAKATTAYEGTAAGSGFYVHTMRDYAIYDGVSFGSGESWVATAQRANIFKNCKLALTTVAGDSWNLGVTGGRTDWENVEFTAATAGGMVRHGGGGIFTWIGGGIDSGGAAPTYALKLDLGSGGAITLKGLDLSNVATSVLFIGVWGGGVWKVYLIGCILPTGKPLLNAALSGSSEVIAHSCDTGDGYWYFEEDYIEGQIVQATNCYLNATYDGTNGFSAKMVSNANAIDSVRPLRFKLSEFYATANPTLTVETITSGVTLQDDEFWLEIDYPNSTNEALRDQDDSSRQGVGWTGGSGPGTPANLTTSTEAWTEDLVSEVKQKIAVTISSGAAGIHTVYACLAKPSTTVYVDPDVTVS